MGYVKQYKCPECGEYGDAKLWDEETTKHYDEVEIEYVQSIESDSRNNCEYYCFNCKSLVNGKNIIPHIKGKLEEQSDDELIEYFVVNSELNMSLGKTAAQVAHVATIIAVKHYLNKWDYFHEWYENNQKKIILQGKQKDLEKLIEQGFYYIRDIGCNEVLPNSLTCCGLPPMPRSEAQKYIKRLQLYK